METATATVVAALIGALIGSVTPELVRQWRKARTEEQTRRRDAAQLYLLQIQDALESLWFRLDNLANRGGTHVMTADYYTESTVYVVGSFLAHKRRLMLEGAFALFDVFGAEFPVELDRHLEAVEREFDVGGKVVSFYRYERQYLADSLLSWDEQWRVRGYDEFAAAFDAERRPYSGAARFVDAASAGKMARLQAVAGEAVRAISTRTGFEYSERIG